MDTNKESLHKEHPLLFRAYLMLALIDVFLGLNFMFSDLAVDPFDLNKYIPGSMFLVNGLAILICILFVRNLDFLRLAIAASIVGSVFWGTNWLISAVEDDISYQLAILYLGMTALQFLLLVEVPEPLNSDTDG